MKKIVTTCMSSDYVSVAIRFEDSSIPECMYHFPVDIINPRTSLQIATLLSSDSSMPKSAPCDETES